MENFERQGRNLLGGSQIFLVQASCGTHNGNAKIILKVILILFKVRIQFLNVSLNLKLF